MTALLRNVNRKQHTFITLCNPMLFVPQSRNYSIVSYFQKYISLKEIVKYFANTILAQHHLYLFNDQPFDTAVATNLCVFLGL